MKRIVGLRLERWSFTNAPGVSHIGPMAQDFHAAFNVGDDERHIATVDADGVALAAIQGLNHKVEEKDARINELEQRLEKLEQRLTLKARHQNGGVE